jgi:hypothetical protein
MDHHVGWSSRDDRRRTLRIFAWETGVREEMGVDEMRVGISTREMEGGKEVGAEE